MSYMKSLRPRSSNLPTASGSMMHVLYCAVVALMITATTSLAANEEQPPVERERGGGSTGVGVVLGDLDGISIKYWKNPAHAFQLRLGTMSQLNSAGAVITYLYHMRPVQVPDRTFSVPFYMGGGVRVSMASPVGTDQIYLDGGVSFLGGMSILVPNLPVEIFFELRPVIAVYNPRLGTVSQVGLGFFLEGGLGAHYYF